MKQILFILILVTATCKLNAQFDNNVFPQSNYKSCVEANSNIDFVSSSISNQFMNTFLWKDHIDSTTKQWMYNALKKNNVTGFDFDNTISCITFPDTFVGVSDIGVFASFGKHYHADINMTDDALRLFFGGNKQFKGATADIAQSSLNLVSYQQLMFGILTKFGQGSTHHKFGVGISINQGIKNIFMNIERGSLYTAPEAEYIDFSAEYEYYQSDTSNNWNIKGMGTSLYFYYTFQTKENDRFNFQISNLGFIHWNKNSRKFANDTTIHFEGATITDPLNIEENIFENANVDSIKNSFLFYDEKESYYMMLPALVRISYLHNFSDKFSMELSATKKFYCHYQPFLLSKAQYYYNKNNMLSLNLSYGGYALNRSYVTHNINTGIEYVHQFKNNCSVQLGSNYINGLIYANSQTVQGVYVSLKKYFF